MVELEQRLPGADRVPVVVVYYRDGGVTAADRALALDDFRALSLRYPAPAADGGQGAKDGPGRQASPVIASQDGTTLFYVVLLPPGEDPQDQVGTIRELVGRGADGLIVKVTGPGGTCTT